MTSVAATLDTDLASLPLSLSKRAILTFDSEPDTSVVQELQTRGLNVADPFSVLPMLVVTGSVQDLIELDDLPHLRSVYLDRPQELLLDLTVAKVTVDGAAYDLDCGGVLCDGAGVAIAVIDTGVDGTHPDLCLDGSALTPPMPTDALCPGQEPVMLQNVEVLTDDPMNPVVVEGVMNSDQTGGHGTHVASIVAGQGQASSRFRGTAPGARLVGVSAGDAVAVLNTTLAIEWVIANRDRYGIRVINNSWGSTAGAPYDPNHPVIVASSAAAEAGLVVVFSAGNSGPGTDSMNMYSRNPDVLSVAAGAARTVTADDIAQGNLIPRDPIEEPATFSAVGIPGSEHAHPDLMAPGQFVIAARATTGFAGAGDAATDPVFMTDPNELQYYTTHSGTSMAAPHVSGVAAMVVQAARAMGVEPSAETVREILLNSANPFQDGGSSTIWQEYRAGRGYLNALAAVHEALVNAASYSDGTDDRVQPGIVSDVVSFGGSIASTVAGGSCPSTLGLENDSVFRHQFEVFPEALTMDVMADWTVAANDLELCVYDPGGLLTSGRRVESDTASAPVDREHLASPAPGTWTVEVRGILGLEAFDGYASVLYPRVYGPDISVVLTPQQATRETGEVHAITATVSDPDGPVAGAALTWTVSGTGMILAQDEVTDESGRATFLLSSDAAGTSDVAVEAGAAGDQAGVTWVAAAELTMPGQAWGAGKLHSGEKLNLNARREAINGPVTGHLKFEGIERFRASHFLDLTVNGPTASLVAEGRWGDTAGYFALVEVTDQSDPGAGADTFLVEIRAGDPAGPLVATASGTLAAGDLAVAE
ncbi:MAG: S8 family serine peptidase [Xanthomonadales bacterium]|nr:S8 family serine peptidase [Xanthomonadales bacterium]